MSDSRPPRPTTGPHARPTTATPPLGTPPLHPSATGSSPAVPDSQQNLARPSARTMPPNMHTPPTGVRGVAPPHTRPAPYGPPLPAHQSQIVPPTPFPSQPYPTQPTLQRPVTPTAAIPIPRKTDRGTLPAIPAVSPPVPTAPPGIAATRPTSGTLRVAPTQASFQTSRIMVQYPQVGSKLNGARGTYEVRAVIGSGEFGAVYECIGPFDQIYAVKMVRPSNRQYAEVHAEWAREVQRLFSLRHPNVVYIYDSFAHDHLFYLALERCDHPLKSMLGAPMQEGLVLELARQLLSAVQFLHDNDVVHDDLHAGNVLITYTDRPTVKISDFGISHELRGMTAVRPNVVHHAIMAPEILATGYTSRQSDLYQVGLLLYWMLTGEPAMQMEVPYQELVRQVADGEPRQRAEQLRTPIGQLIAKMLRRREAFRYTSAREVWADLRELPAWQQRDLFPAK